MSIARVRWRFARVFARRAYARAEIAATAEEWWKSPGVAASAAFHSVILIVLVILAYPWLKAGGPSKIVAVEVVMMRSTISAVPHEAPNQRAVVAAQPNAGASAAPQKEQENDAPPTRAAPSASSSAAQEKVLPELKPNPDVPQKAADMHTAATPSADPAPKPATDAGGNPVAAGSQKTALENAFVGQLLACWAQPMAARTLSRAAIDFDVFLNRDGTVARVPQLTADYAVRAPRDPLLRASAEALQRAIFACAPYRLPAVSYDQWREINPLHFDPSQVIR